MSLLRATLTPDEKRKVEAARQKAFILYEGKATPHRSCGIALAETFNLPTRPYQALRRGGLTGEGECGAIKAGELVLGEILGDPDPTGAVTPILGEAVREYQEEWKRRADLGPSASGKGAESLVQIDANVDIICNHLTAPFGDFTGPGRHGFCTSLAATVAEIVAEILLRAGVELEIEEVPKI